MLLYCDTRLARIERAAWSWTGAETEELAKGEPAVVTAVPPRVPIVEDAASLVVVILMAPVESIVASRLFQASLLLRSFRLLTVPPVPSPKVMLVAVPLPVAPIVKVLPSRRPTEAVLVPRAVVPAVSP